MTNLNSILLKGIEFNKLEIFEKHTDIIILGHKLYITNYEEVLKLLFLLKQKFNPIYKKKNIIYKIFKLKKILKKLDKLDFSKSKLTVTMLNYLVNYNLSQLKRLNLENNLSGNSDFFERFNFPNLKYLNLSGNRLNEKSFYFLSSAEIKSLKYLYLKGSIINENSKNFLTSNKCQIFSKLEILDLGFTKMPSSFLEYITQSLTNLKDLNLSGNNFSENEYKIISKNRFKCLTALDLSYMKINRKNMSVLANGNFEYLRKLTLKSCSIDEKALSILSESIKFQRLTYLNLSKNLTYNWKSEIFSNFNNLQTFILSENNFTDNGAKNLAAAKFKNLGYLDLSFNFLTREGLESLLEEYKDSLLHFDISYNYLGCEGIKDAIVFKYKYLEFLDVSHNEISRNEAIMVLNESICEIETDLYGHENSIDNYIQIFNDRTRCIIELIKNIDKIKLTIRY